MPKVPVYNQEGKVVKEMELQEAIFGVVAKDSVLHQVYVAEMNNRRVVVAHTKTKGEVRGGGKKPWKQKGTGRARQGSTRAPQWKGGGVVFGPRSNRNFEEKINKKMKAAAIKMALSSKVKDGQMFIVEALKMAEPKTKLYAKFLNLLPSKGKTVLFLAGASDKEIKRGLRNIPKVDMLEARSVNLVELMHHKYLILTPESVTVLETSFAKK